MCSITKTPSTPKQVRQPGQFVSTAVIFAALCLGALWSRGLPLRTLSTTYLSAACAATVGFFASLVWFVNYYTGQKLRECSPMTQHLAAMSRKSAPAEWVVDLDKIANPEGLSQMWKDKVLDKGEGYNILLTGVTGYVGRAFLYQLLREIANGEAATGKKVQHKVFVMARAKARKNLSAAQRLEKLREEPMFAPYTKQWDEVVVAAQSGDLQDINCGMSEETLEMLSGAKITHVVHCAADVNFNRPLADSAGINISPALQLQGLAQQWPSCRRFVHCSTAFVNPGHGSDEAPMAEQLFSLGQYDPQALYDSMRGDQKLALAVKEEMAFPNNYVFTKCVAEHLVVRNNKKMELKIVRPAIVGPAWALPEPGWNGEKPSTITALLLLWGTRVIRFAPLTKRGIPMVPVDVVVVCIIHAMISPPMKPLAKSDSTAESPVSIRNLIWSHKSPRSVICGMNMANVCLGAAVSKHHFSSTETAISVALIDLVYKIPQVFPILHLIFNLGPLYFLQLVCWVVKTLGIKSVLEQVPVVKLLKFSDMLTLYKPYMGRSYYFESDIDVPETMDMNQYCASLFKATHSFWATLFPGTVEELSVMELLPKGRFDLWWALTFPSRNFPNRIIAYLSCKILRETHGSVCVDIDTLEEAAEVMMELEATALDRKHCVLLASKNETPMDDVLTKFVAFSMAALGLDIPTTIGQADFEDKDLAGRIGEIKTQYDRHTTLAAKLGESPASDAFLHSLVNSTGEQDYTVIPVCMDYEHLEEKDTEVKKSKTSSGADLKIRDLISLYWQVCVQGKFKKAFGGVKISYGKPSEINAQSDFRSVISNVELEHCRLSSISAARLAAAEADPKIPTAARKEAAKTLRVAVVSGNEESKAGPPSTPTSRSNWNLHKQWIPNYAPYLNESHPDWAGCIAGGRVSASNPTAVPRNGEIDAVLKAICAIFDAADYLAVRAKVSLHEKKMENPTPEELVKEMEFLDEDLKVAASSFIFETAASIALQKSLSSVVAAECEEKKEY